MKKMMSVSYTHLKTIAKPVSFNLVQDKSANAFCMPGGKIVVYEGLLPYTQNEFP